MIDRREFIGTMGAVAVGAMLPACRSAASATRLSKIGVQLYTVRTLMEKDVERTLAGVAAAGYTEVEFAGYFNKTPAEIKAMLDRHGLVAPSVHSGNIAADAWAQALDAAHVIGHQFIVVPWIPEERRKTLDDWKQVAADFNRIATAAKAAGIQMAYHNHDFEFPLVEGKVPYDVLLAETDPNLVKLEIDLYWITKGGQDPLAYFARWPGRIPLVHVKDGKGPPDWAMTEVGSGAIDWKRIFGKSGQAGIQHYFVEHDQPADPIASITASCAYLKKLEF
ncbi:MAG TPA: sugar phosphate isomerase/epimerase [Gemmatimonadales bacterium]|nr:sugar phosphate isomerase/epimerase [Gemmatimonadales bacterium]